MGFAALLPSTNVRTRTLSADAPAKINLILEVLDRRADGFHNIHSLALGVGLCDQLACTFPNCSGVTLYCSEATLQTDSNLASRAALLVARSAGCDAQVGIDLKKRIPIGAGLGGGSSDAAATMKLCNALWDAGFSNLELAEMSAELGSDVPLFFHLPAVEVSGRGECVSPVAMHWSGYVLLVFPGIHVSTANVYREWRRDDVAGAHSTPFEGVRGLASADELHEHLVNQLEPAVYRVAPKVLEAQRAVESLGVPSTRVTGSGSAFFRLYDEEDRARHDARRIEQNVSGMRVEVVAAPVGMPRIEERET